MQLTQIPNVSRTILTALNAAGWTVERIATTTPDRLAALPGIGAVTAAKLIAEAKRLANQELLKESKVTMMVWPGGVPPQPAHILYYPSEPVRRSLRVQRIYESMQ